MERSVLEGKGDNSQQIRPSANVRRWDAGQTLRSSLATCETNPTTAPLQRAFPSSPAGLLTKWPGLSSGALKTRTWRCTSAGAARSSSAGKKLRHSQAFTAMSPESSPAIGVPANWVFATRRSPSQHEAAAEGGEPGHTQTSSSLLIPAADALSPNHQGFTRSRWKQPKASTSSRYTRHTPKDAVPTTAGSSGRSPRGSRTTSGTGCCGPQRNSESVSSSSKDPALTEPGERTFTQNSKHPREHFDDTSSTSHYAQVNAANWDWHNQILQSQ